uniref:hypothetical protein n=1 Tax=Raoultella ornithinolytica TaxID=54291 RepID=UPI0019673E59
HDFRWFSGLDERGLLHVSSTRTMGSPGLQEFDIKLIDTVDLEGGPGTFLLFNEFGQCVLLMCSVSLSLIGMSISITDRDSR